MNLIEHVARKLCRHDGRDPDAVTATSPDGAKVVLQWQNYASVAMTAAMGVREFDHDHGFAAYQDLSIPAALTAIEACLERVGAVLEEGHAPLDVGEGVILALCAACTALKTSNPDVIALINERRRAWRRSPPSPRPPDPEGGSSMKLTIRFRYRYRLSDVRRLVRRFLGKA